MLRDSTFLKIKVNSKSSITPQGSKNEYQTARLRLRWGAFTCAVWQVTLCDPTWQVTLRSSEMGDTHTRRAIHTR